MSIFDKYATNQEMKASMVGELIGALRDAMANAPGNWQSLPKNKQTEILENFKQRAIHLVHEAVEVIAADGRTAIAAAVDQVVFKDGLKVVLKATRRKEAWHDIADAELEGKEVLIVLTDKEAYGDPEVEGEDEQREMFA